MRIKLLKEISEIIAGYTFREALKEDERGNRRVLLLKNINENTVIDYENMPKINMKNARTNALVQQGDVILSSRGIFRAGVFSQQMENVIAASSIYILRTKSKNFLSEFLAIYLNSKKGQADIQKILTGSTIKTILRKQLELLAIPIPNLENQKRIIEIKNNWYKREQLLNQKIKLGKNIAEEAINQLLTD